MVTVTSSSWTSRRLQVPSQPQNSKGHSHFFGCLGCSLVNLTKNMKSFTFIWPSLETSKICPISQNSLRTNPSFCLTEWPFSPTLATYRGKIIVCLLCLMLQNLTDSNLVLDPPPQHASQDCPSSSGASQVALFIYWQQVRCLPPYCGVILTSPQHTDVWGTTPK